MSATLAGFIFMQDARCENNDTSESSQSQRPEPMVFDLVDPLDAKKGELEINALLNFSPQAEQLRWSPEIEYSYMDGHSIELELPIENDFLQQYKVSLQGSFGKLAQGRMLHGWQAIGRRKNDEKVFAAEILYLNDYKFSDTWSMMNMFGVRHTALGKSGDFVGVLNNTLFYSYSKHLALGIELNSEIEERRWRYRLTPQVQYVFNKHSIIQVGGGPSQLNSERTEWLLTSRVIYDF
ncbi:hypothetical protein SAMN05216417_11228 [Nitrosospira multiformis]|uniref:Copper resistance protein B n=1 Tax=Nitrosospira multiformis TaxID=1231 RepID=A0A1I7HVY9_9PROT|nr:hypothetical protein SAMN05216417_11228 [Nitrosospira multiformis]